VPEALLITAVVMEGLVELRPVGGVETLALLFRFRRGSHEDEVADEVGRQEGLPPRVQRLEDHLRIVTRLELNDYQLQRSLERLTKGKDSIFAPVRRSDFGDVVRDRIMEERIRCGDSR
jgi:hypothetical protein